MAIDIWWYDARSQWAADVPTKDGRKRLYLGTNEQKARAELHRYMATYYDEANGSSDSKTALRGSINSVPLVQLAVHFLVTVHGFSENLPSVFAYPAGAWQRHPQPNARIAAD